jgi:hypothetical protein
MPLDRGRDVLSVPLYSNADAIAGMKGDLFKVLIVWQSSGIERRLPRVRRSAAARAP